MISKKNGIGWLVTSTFILVHWPASPALADKGCLTCHSKVVSANKGARKKRGFVLDTKAIAKSVHKDLECTDCHTQLADADASKAHKPKFGRPSCYCHEDAVKAYTGSVHGRAQAEGDGEVARCGDCHGAHDILPVKDPESRVFKMRLPFTCARCHENADLAKRHKIKRPNAAKRYIESIHGHGLIKDGLIVAPSCTDCHGSHDIQKDSRPPDLHPG